MKKFISIILTILTVSVNLVFFVNAENKVFIYAGEGIKCSIIVPVSCSETENYAAVTLQNYIEEITGEKPSISTSEPKIKGKEIYIISSDKLPNGGYTIKAEENALYLTGSGSRGNIYSVYGFLEKYCDCHWYTKDVKVIPKSETISVPENEEYTYTPFFESTETDWISPTTAEYSLANGLCGGSYRRLSPEQGGTVDYIAGLAHTLTTKFCNSDTYFESHPEYFALRNGKRVPDQLCLTNPEVQEIVTKEVLQVIKEKYDPTQSLQIVSVTQNDNRNYCTCDKCKAVDDANGSQAGTMITFANNIAREVKKAGYDNIAIDTFAYQYTRHTPSQVVPDDNVIVRICSIECCFGHSLNDENCSQNVEFMKDLEGWSKICKRIHVWDYATNYGYTVNLFPDFGVLQKNMQMFYEHNVKGVYEEGAYYLNSCDGEFGELRAYLLSKLMQNPYTDYDKEMNGFLKAYYGAGWENIRKFIDIAISHAVTNKNHMTIGQDVKKTLKGISSKEIKYCNELWENTKNQADNDIYLNRIRRSELCWRFWKCCNKKLEFSPLKPLILRMAEREKLYNDYKSFGVVRFGENPSRVVSDCKSLYLLRPATKWIILYDENYWVFFEPYIVKFYETALKLFYNIER